MERTRSVHSASATSRHRACPNGHVREIASGVYCLGPWGRTQTVVYFVRSAESWVLVDAGWPGDGPSIAAAAEGVFGPGFLRRRSCSPTTIPTTKATP